jgi:hypothetical protein
MVLILRECLDADNPLLRQLAKIHSRTVTPTSLYNLINPFCQTTDMKSILFKPFSSPSSQEEWETLASHTATSSASSPQVVKGLKPAKNKGKSTQEEWDRW